MRIRVIHKLATVLLACATVASAFSQDRKVGGPCEGCELLFEGIPTSLSNTAIIADKEEPGQRLVITGRIFKKDGKTPAAGVILYVYQTDASGRYSPSVNQKKAVKHGHLRGWVKTDATGKYTLITIRPGSYPNTTAAAHLHPTIKEEGLTAYYLDEYLFDDDPFVDDATRKRNATSWRGGPGIMKVTKLPDGSWQGTRDLILGLNIPDYEKP